MPPYFRRLIFLIALALVGHSQALSAQTATTTNLSLLSGGTPVTSVPAGTMVTMSATVTGGTSPITTGTIYFCDSVVKNCMLMPTATAHVVNGSTTFKTVLGIGSYSFTAMYVPTAGFGASTSSAVTLTVPASAAPTFSPSMTSSYGGGNYSLFAPLSAPTYAAPTGTITVTDTTAGTPLGSFPILRTYVAPASLTLASHLSGDSRGACTTVTGDFNGDGHPDIAIGSGCKSADGLNSPAALQILLGNGDGTFTAGPTVPAAMTNTNVIALTVGDFNNDGTLDLIAADNQASGGGATYTPHLYLLANDGAANFTATQIGQGCTAAALVTSDLNRDGNLDFVASCSAMVNNQAMLNVFLSDGAGGFTQTNTGLYPTQSGYMGPDIPQTGFAIADFNNDGYPDLVSADNGGGVSLNTGTGKDFTQGIYESIQVPDVLIAGDFNGDGNADFMVLTALQGHAYSNGMNIYPFYGDGSGGFTAGNMGATPNYWLGLPGTFVSIADLNHDGIADTVSSAESPYPDGIYINFNNKLATLTSPGTVNSLTSAIADFNGDGIPDVVLANSATDGADIYTLTDDASASVQSQVYVLGTGTHDIAVTYSGDAVYPAVTNHISVTAGTVPTGLSLTASPNPEFVGNPVTVTALLTPYHVTVGSNTFTTNGQAITFTSGGTTLGTGTLTNGIATLNLPNLPLGPTTINASYAGDTNFAATSLNNSLVVTIKAPTVPTVNPTSINFGNIDYTTSASHTVTLTNTATGTLTITSIQTSTGFSQTNNCGGSLASAASCTITITVAPTTPGTSTGTLTVNTNASTPTTIVALSATGVVYPTVQLTASPSSAVIGTSVTFTATITPVSVGSATANGGYIYFSSGSTTSAPVLVTNGKAAFTTQNLPAGANVVSASFSGGSSYAGANSNNVTVTVTNIALPSTSPTSVSFGTVGIGSSVSQTVTFTNTDTVSALAVASVQVSNGFSLINHCGATLAPLASCTATVTFTPTAAASVTGTLTFTTNANTPTRTVALSGTGVVPTLSLLASPAPAPVGAPVTLTATLTPYSAGSLSTNGKTVNFSSGSTPLGTATLTNGVATLSLTSLPLGSDSIIATFTGDADFASVTSSPATVTITAPPPPTVSPTSINFGAVHLGFSTTNTVNLTNTSTGPLTIGSIMANSGGFTQTNNCGSTLAAAASCTVTLTFAPTTAGAATGSLAITTNASAPITTVALSGSGIAPVLYLTASPTSTSIGTQVALTATLTPYTNGNLTTNGRTVAFTSGSTALGTATLNNGTALLNLTNLPIGSHSIVATFTGDANFPTATSSAVVVTITGPSAPTVSPSSVDFGAVTLGNSVSQTVTLTNVAATPLTITAVQASGGFTQTNTCGNLAVSASCTATVTFAPTTAGTATGTLIFTTTAVTTTTTVSLSGSGVAAVSPSAGGGSFGTLKPGSSAALPVSFTTAPGVSGTLTTTCTVKTTNGGAASNPPTCTASPSTFTVSGGSTVTTTLTVNTTVGSSAALHIPETGIVLAGGLLGLLAFFRRRPAIASLLILLFSFTAMTIITGCAGGGDSSSSGSGGSGGGTPTPSTTAGAYTVTVTATIGTQTSSLDLPLTIQ